MKIACAYTRVSTDDQAEYSLDAQIRAIREYAERNGYKIPDEFVFCDKGISGRKTENRTEFLRMIKMAKKKPKVFDVIFVHKFDRFARNREDSILYKSLLKKDCDIKVVSITEPLEDDKISILIEAIIEAMGEYYSLNLSEEVMKGLKEKALRGEYCGVAPMGYKNNKGKLQIDKEYAEIVKEIFELYKYKSTTAIAKELNEMGVRTNNGKVWTQTTISRILKNEVYIGKVIYNKNKEPIVVENAHEMLISEKDFDLARKKIEKESDKLKKGVKQHECKSFLHSLAYCSECGKKLTISKSKNSYQFRCSQHRHQKCKVGNTISVEKLEKMFIKQLEKDFDFDIDIFYVDKNCEANKEKLIKQKKAIELKIERSKIAYVEGVDTLDDYKESKKNNLNKIKSIDEEIERIKCFMVVEKMFNKISLLFEYQSISKIEKRGIAEAFVDGIKVSLLHKNIEIWYIT